MKRFNITLATCMFSFFCLAVGSGEESRNKPGYDRFAFEGKAEKRMFDYYLRSVGRVARRINEEPTPDTLSLLKSELVQVELMRSQFLEYGVVNGKDLSDDERAHWVQIKRDADQGQKTLSKQEVEVMGEEEVRRRINGEISRVKSIPSRSPFWRSIELRN